jgi:hypothetical protein
VGGKIRKQGDLHDQYNSGSPGMKSLNAGCMIMGPEKDAWG